MAKKFAISMFSGGGISELGFEKHGVEFIVENEILPDRAALAKLNHPKAELFVDDAWNCQAKIIDYAKKILHDYELFLFLATPPCQGMSSNGAGTLLNNARKGLRSKMDPRNRLIIPALKVASKLNPEWIIFENVIGMKNTVIINDDDKHVKILDLIPTLLGNNYVGKSYAIEFADYGLPQRRKRLITIYTRNQIAKNAFSQGISLVPPPTHDKSSKNGLKSWITMRDALAGFEKLDAKDTKHSKSKKHLLHRIPIMDPKKYFWVKHTPQNSTAFDNQCVNPDCKYQGNPKHGTKRDKRGINQSKKNTPLYCVKCGSLLPRPYVDKKGKKQLMSGYVSAYKRMSWDSPASTLTTNFLYTCSDNKIHPEENRTLSFLEALKLQSISDYNYKWGPFSNGNGVAPDTLIKNVIGESAPPMFFDRLYDWITKLSTNQIEKNGILAYVDLKLQ